MRPWREKTGGGGGGGTERQREKKGEEEGVEGGREGWGDVIHWGQGEKHPVRNPQAWWWRFLRRMTCSKQPPVFAVL